MSLTVRKWWSYLGAAVIAGGLLWHWRQPNREVPPESVTFPEVRAAATNAPAEFAAIARQNAHGEAKKLIRFAEIGVNAQLYGAAAELLGDALEAARNFGESFHIMRLAYKCGDAALAERAAAIARTQATTDFQKAKLEHFQTVYAQRSH